MKAHDLMAKPVISTAAGILGLETHSNVTVGAYLAGRLWPALMAAELQHELADVGHFRAGTVLDCARSANRLAVSMAAELLEQLEEAEADHLRATAHGAAAP